MAIQYSEVSSTIRERLQKAGKRFYANDNISEFIQDGELALLTDELESKFAAVLNSLIIDTVNDPNSFDTPRRLAKMYIGELMEGRYFAAPDATAFPNTGEEKYTGMMVVRADITSMCSHHHQQVWGTAYVGIIPGETCLGLSKYVRLAQWVARRGTLQEQLCNKIAKTIGESAKCDDVAVYLKLKHGCCTFRGINSSDSTTQTTVLTGAFERADVKKEFFDNIMIQENNK